jgi:hypothetical protein
MREREVRHLEVIMVGEPKGGEYDALRRAGRALGVPVGRIMDPEWPFRPTGPLYALETWRGIKAHDLRDVYFPDRVSVIMGTTNQGLDPRWRDVIEGSVYIDTRGGLLLPAPTAGAILMYEWSRQRERV